MKLLGFVKVLKSQNRTINEGVRQSGDFTQLQSQLAESERTAERAHVEGNSIRKLNILELYCRIW